MGLVSNDFVMCVRAGSEGMQITVNGQIPRSPVLLQGSGSSTL